MWIAWIGATVAAGISMTFVIITFAYGQFETRDHAKERVDSLTDRLIRIENKLDAIQKRD